MVCVSGELTRTDNAAAPRDRRGSTEADEEVSKSGPSVQSGGETLTDRLRRDLARREPDPPRMVQAVPEALRACYYGVIVTNIQ